MRTEEEEARVPVLDKGAFLPAAETLLAPVGQHQFLTTATLLMIPLQTREAEEEAEMPHQIVSAPVTDLWACAAPSAQWWLPAWCAASFASWWLQLQLMAASTPRWWPSTRESWRRGSHWWEMEMQTGRTGRRNRSPPWPRGMTGRGRVGFWKGEGWKGQKLKGLEEERDGSACFMHTDSYGISPSWLSNWHLSPTFCFPFLVPFLFLTFSLCALLSNTHILYPFPDFSPPFGGILTAVFVTNHPSNSPTNHLLLLLAAAEFTIILAEKKNYLVLSLA